MPATLRRHAVGYRSRLEAKHAEQIEEALGKGASSIYESEVIRYTKPASEHRYTPDWPMMKLGLPFIIESKGLFLAEDRAKHLLIKEQHPELEVRFVFSNANAPIYPKAKTTHAQWASKNGFKWAHKVIPLEWLRERVNH